MPKEKEMESEDSSVDALSREQRLQEEQYRFPYHYIPTLDGGGFAQHRYWGWGMRYLGGLELVLDRLQELDYESLVDIGCGDGRFLHELREREPGKRLLGIDYSARAIRLAQALTPDVSFAALDITRESVDVAFDVGTLIEVLEHIPPEDLPDFVTAVRRLLRPEHTLLITVPHANKRLTPKHYQHFTSRSLRALLEPHYADLAFIPFDARTTVFSPLRWVTKLAGGRGRFFILTNRRVLRAMFRLYRKRYLYAATEGKCERIAVICRN